MTGPPQPLVLLRMADGSAAALVVHAVFPISRRRRRPRIVVKPRECAALSSTDATPAAMEIGLLPSFHSPSPPVVVVLAAAD